MQLKLDSFSDGISGLDFGGSRLLVGSWDSHVYLYETNNNKRLLALKQRAAILDCKFLKDKIVAGGLSKSLSIFDSETGSENILGDHHAPIKAISTTATDPDRIVTGSWDSTVKIWDARSSNVDTIQQRGKVYSMDSYDMTLVVALSSKQIQIYDLRNMNTSLDTYESTLKHMLRCIGLMRNGTGYATGSVEGRISVDYIDNSPAMQAKKFSFKCHRKTVDIEQIYSVNSIAFHPVHHSAFASGGSDGVVNLWDASLKKKLKQFEGYPTSISALRFSPDGSKLAVASSYTFDEGERDHPKDEIWIRNITDENFALKPRQ